VYVAAFLLLHFLT